jgi:hypothetical protein
MGGGPNVAALFATPSAKVHPPPLYSGEDEEQADGQTHEYERGHHGQQPLSFPISCGQAEGKSGEAPSTDGWIFMIYDIRRMSFLDGSACCYPYEMWFSVVHHLLQLQFLCQI